MKKQNIQNIFQQESKGADKYNSVNIILKDDGSFLRAVVINKNKDNETEILTFTMQNGEIFVTNSTDKGSYIKLEEEPNRNNVTDLRRLKDEATKAGVANFRINDEEVDPDQLFSALDTVIQQEKNKLPQINVQLGGEGAIIRYTEIDPKRGATTTELINYEGGHVEVHKGNKTEKGGEASENLRRLYNSVVSKSSDSFNLKIDGEEVNKEEFLDRVNMSIDIWEDRKILNEAGKALDSDFIVPDAENQNSNEGLQNRKSGNAPRF